MPTYVYKCNDCNLAFEDLSSKVNSNLTTKCKCGGEASRIIYKVPAIKYVGIGWASVDSQTEKRLVEATELAEHMYEKRSEQVQSKVSDDDFFQEVAKELGD